MPGLANETFPKLALAYVRNLGNVLSAKEFGTVIRENWKEPASGEWIRTFAITTDANELVAIHDRMCLSSSRRPTTSVGWARSPTRAT
jgi:hypothetical protein